MNKKKILAFLLVVVVVLAACAPQQEEPIPVTGSTPLPTATPTQTPPNSIVDVALNDGRFTTLVSALTAADLVDTLRDGGPFTVFAPTNEAFALLPDGILESLLNDIPTLTNILLYHVIDGGLTANDVMALDLGVMLNGDPFLVKEKDGFLHINNAKITVANIPADNGIVHVIDAVLLPPEDIVDTAIADGRFNTLETALEAAGLLSTLKGEGPFTVFAPTDDAFAKLPEGTVAALLSNQPALTDILLYHVASGDVLAKQVAGLKEVITLQGQPVKVEVSNGKVMLNDAEVLITDILASNGIIHVIDTVLQPLPDIIEAAEADGRFTTLLTALDLAGLTEALKGKGPYTVFAPTDAAFAALPAGTLDALVADIPALTDVLRYHLVIGKYLAKDVIQLDFAKTAQGKPVMIEVEDGKVMLNDAEVIITDIETSNGVIHVIDTVLVPPPNLIEAAEADGRFTTLLAALEAANLTKTLATGGLYTVFAPTDAAFAKLPAGTLDALLNDIPQLTEILLYHVVDGKLMAEDVVTLSTIPTLQGSNLGVIVNGTVKVDESTVIITDLVTANGVIHVIDTVLLPE
jgi:transforming growth factor-beta-induced protein